MYCRQEIKSNLLACLVYAILISFITWWTVIFSNKQPIAKWSTSKNECVKVYLDGKWFDCTELEKRGIKLSEVERDYVQ